MEFFSNLKFVCFLYILILISLGLIGSMYVTDDKAGWLIPLLIGISLLFLILALAFLIKRKIDLNREEIEEPPPEIIYEEAGNKEDRDKLTLNPVFEENHDKVLYLPSDAAVLADMQVIAVERFQGEVLPWPGENDGKEEISAEFVFEDEETSLQDAEISFPNDAFDAEEPIYDEAENFHPFPQMEDGEKIYVDLKGDLRAIDLEFPWLGRTKFEKARQKFSPKAVLTRTSIRDIKRNAILKRNSLKTMDME